MFSKRYPRNCTMIKNIPNISRKYGSRSVVVYFVGSGDWEDGQWTGIFFEFPITHLLKTTKSSMVGFRGSTYVH
jgi:hypothetical protein